MSSAFKRGEEKNVKKSIDVSIKKSIELLDKYNNLNEYYDDLSARRVLDDANEDKLRYNTKN